MTIDISQFKVNRREGEFDVRFRVEGEVSRTIKAASLSEAKIKAQEMVEDEDGDDLLELDEIHDARVDWVSQKPDMYLVARGGRKMQVSHIQEGDLPRDPDERGW